jgi:hypothetical protein
VDAFPLADDQCLMEQGLAWGDLRYEAWTALMDALQARGRAGDAAASREYDRLAADDDARRVANGDACVGAADHDACRAGREVKRAGLYRGLLDDLTAG